MGKSKSKKRRRSPDSSPSSGHRRTRSGRARMRSRNATSSSDRGETPHRSRRASRLRHSRRRVRHDSARVRRRRDSSLRRDRRRGDRDKRPSRSTSRRSASRRSASRRSASRRSASHRSASRRSTSHRATPRRRVPRPSSGPPSPKRCCPLPTTSRMSELNNINDVTRLSIENVTNDTSLGQNRLDASSETNNLSNQFTQLLETLKATLNKPSTNEKFSMIHNTVPEFDPSKRNQTMVTWLAKVNEIASLYGWTERETIHYSLPKLTGMAQQWYQGLPTVLFTWDEWQSKLLSAFPGGENFGVMLTDMLNKKARFGRSLEEYFYEKVSLLNRCEIYGKKAVDCIVLGIEDRTIRMGAEAGQYTDSDKLLNYLRSVRIPFKGSDRTENHTVGNKDRNPKFQPKCYNCGTLGHVYQKCSLPIKRCSGCKNIGHTFDECNKSKTNPTGNTKKVMFISGLKPDAKYYKTAMINDVEKDCFIDMGSHYTLLRQTDGYQISKHWDDCSDFIAGFGHNAGIKSLGKGVLNISIDGVQASVETHLVPDELLNVPVLIGHGYTEQNHIFVCKTAKELVFHNSEIDTEQDNINLICSNDTIVQDLTVVPMHSDPIFSGDVYVDAGFRTKIGSEHVIMPGYFQLNEGKGCLLIRNDSGKDITIKEGSLLKRVNATWQTANFNSERHNNCVNTGTDVRKIKNDEVVVGDDLGINSKHDLVNLLNEFRDCFALDMKELGKCTAGSMKIVLNDERPVTYRPYRLSYKEREEVRNMIQELLDCNIIRESTSAYSSPIILVAKKTGEKRMCIDYRALNKKTIKEQYPMPRIDDQIDRLNGFAFFTILDLASGYYQIALEDNSKHVTSFVTPDGQYEFNRMPFGLANAPSTFQRTLNHVLGQLRYNEVIAYMDDIIIPSATIEDGMKRLRMVLEKLREYSLTLKLTKCNFFMSEVDFLGFEVSKEGIRPGSKKIESVTNFPTPQSQHNVRQFLGLASFFRRFVKNFSTIAKPLTNLLKKDSIWKWENDEIKAFETLKKRLTERPILAIYDPHAKTELHTDASKLGIGSMLLQRSNNEPLKVVAYYSRQTTPEEQHWSSYELETLAVVVSLNKFRVYLIGIEFKIVTDCNSLRATFNKKDMIPRVARWWSMMQEYNYEIEYRPGSRMTHVDALSRNPVTEDSNSKEDNVYEKGVFRIVDESNWVATVQDIDDDVKRIKDILEKTDITEIQHIHDNFTIKKNVLYRKSEDGDKLVIPKGSRWQILKKCHDDIGHFSYDKTIAKLKENYWFKKMNKFTRKYVDACLECAYNKVPSGKKQGMLHSIPKVDRPFHTIHMDHLGPFVKSTNGNSYLLVIVEAFTKFTYIKPVRNTQAKSTIKVLKEYFSIFGVPERLISDQGSGFTSKQFRKFTNDLKFKHVLNAVATPRANGQVERYNRTILTGLASSNHNKAENRWDECVGNVQWGINNTFNKGTGKTPAEVLFGFKPVGQSESSILNEVDSEQSLQERDEIRTEVVEHIHKNQEEQSTRYNKNRKVAKKYKLGDLVRVERLVQNNPNNTDTSRKLLPKYCGPYKITAVVDHDRYEVTDTPITKKGNKIYKNVVAIDKIMPWLSFSRNESSSEEDLLIDNDGVRNQNELDTNEEQISNE